MRKLWIYITAPIAILVGYIGLKRYFRKITSEVKKDNEILKRRYEAFKVDAVRTTESNSFVFDYVDKRVAEEKASLEKSIAANTRIVDELKIVEKEELAAMINKAKSR